MGLVGRLVGEEEEVADKPVVQKSQEGVLFWRYENGVMRWFKDGNEKTDEKYEGEIVNGVPNGQGTLTYPDGDQYVGEWKNSEPWTITEYNKDGNNLDLFVNGK